MSRIGFAAALLYNGAALLAIIICGTFLCWPRGPKGGA